MSDVVYVVYRYFPGREGVELVKAFDDKEAAEAFKAELPTEVDGQACNNWLQKVDFVC